MRVDLQKLDSYIKESLAKGYSKEHVSQALVSGGWNIEIVNKAFAALEKSGVTLSTPQAVDVRSNIAFKMWAVPISIAVLLFIVFSIYEFFRTGQFSLSSLNAALAGTAALGIGFSLALSGISYYFNFLDHEIAYRKHLGLVGYFLALVYSFLLLFVNPDKYFYGFLENLKSADFILGLSSMGILTLMAIVSNNFVMRKIGAHTWRFILRLGYAAYFLLIVRAVILEGEDWFLWLQRLDNLPPGRLLVSIFAALVIALRMSMEFSMRFKLRGS